jgi:hypothetical protein
VCGSALEFLFWKEQWPMNPMNRRDFLERTPRSAAGLAAGLTILANPRSVRATPANERLVLAMIGIGGG